MTKLILVTNIMHTSTLAVFSNITMMILHFFVLKLSQNFSINVLKIAPVMLHSSRTFFFNAKKVFFMTGKASAEFEDVHITSTNGAPSPHHILKQISELDMLFYKNHPFIVNLKSTNFSERKLVRCPTPKCTD